MPGAEVRVVDDDGAAVPGGDVGEIVLKVPTGQRRYWGDDEASAQVWRDGWVYTGDLGRVDDDGYLYVVDRLKDVILRGGENVYAAEVQAVLYEHPDVSEAAIVGVPDAKYGEQIAAIVRLRPGSAIGEQELQAHVASRLAAFKVPSIVRITAETLPRNAAGKVLKRELRESFTGAADN
jgi:acyl-CoA synthetase (AMP-forming)/AMP-acid ligase II